MLLGMKHFYTVAARWTLCLALPLLAACGTSSDGEARFARASVNSSGNQANAASTLPAFAGGGSLVSFTSDASLLIPNDSNGFADVFRYHRTLGQVIRVSVPNTATQANGGSGASTISDDGNVVAFESDATNLVSTITDANGFTDIYLRNVNTSATERISVAALNADPDGASTAPAMNDSGSLVAFVSDATNLDVIPADTNGVSDVFLYNRAPSSTNRTTRISLTNTGVQANGNSFAPAMNSSGTLIAFVSDASDLVVNDTNGLTDIFLRDTFAIPPTTTRLSVGPLGVEGDAAVEPHVSIDDSGQLVVFASAATNLVNNDSNGVIDVFLRDRTAGTTTRLSLGFNGESNGDSTVPTISGNGRWVVFESVASNLVPNDTGGTRDIFQYDRLTGVTTRITEGLGGFEPDGASIHPVIDDLGEHVAFSSVATNLVDSDSNGVSDVFVFDE